MLFKYLALVTAATLSLGSAANALVIGTTNNGNCQPFSCNNSGTATGQSFHYQQIYASTAFDGAGVIDALTFYSWAPTPANVVLNGTYTVTLSTTTAALGSPYAITAMRNTASFFTGNLGGAITGGFTIDGANYAYDPAAGNLLLDIVVTNRTISATAAKAFSRPITPARRPPVPSTPATACFPAAARWSPASASRSSPSRNPGR